MVESGLLEEGVGLICGQRDYIPQIANCILGENITALPEWSEETFDLVWVFDKDSKSGKYLFKRVWQNLLAGDSAAFNE